MKYLISDKSYPYSITQAVISPINIPKLTLNLVKLFGINMYFRKKYSPSVILNVLVRNYVSSLVRSQTFDSAFSNSMKISEHF